MARGQVAFQAYLRPPAQLEEGLSAALSALLVAFLAALTWALSALFWAFQVHARPLSRCAMCAASWLAT